MNRFLSKYPIFSYLTFGILGTIYVVMLLLVEAYGWAVAVALFFGLLAWIMPEGSRLKLMDDAHKKYQNECDPYPLLLECETQLSYIKPWKKRMEIIIYHCVALGSIGRRDLALRELEGIGDEGIKKLNTIWQGVYYTLMIECTAHLLDPEITEKYHLLAFSVKELQGSKKTKEVYLQAINGALAEVCIEKNELEKAEKLEHTIVGETLAIEVEKAYAFGRIYLAQGRREEAYNCLVFVAEKGNRLFKADEARRLLAENYAQ